MTIPLTFMTKASMADPQQVALAFVNQQLGEQQEGFGFVVKNAYTSSGSAVC